MTPKKKLDSNPRIPIGKHRRYYRKETTSEEEKIKQRTDLKIKILKVDYYQGTHKNGYIENAQTIITQNEWERLRDIRKKNFKQRNEYLRKHPKKGFTDLTPPSRKEYGFRENPAERGAKSRVRNRIAGAIYDFSRLCSERPLWTEKHLEKKLSDLDNSENKKDKKRIDYVKEEIEESKGDANFNCRIEGPHSIITDSEKTFYSSYFHPQGPGPYRPKDLAIMISADELFSIVFATVALLGNDYAKAVGEGLIRGLKYRSERGDGFANPKLKIESEYNLDSEFENTWTDYSII